MARRRSYNRRVTNLLDACAAPVYLLDAERTIVYCNSACAEWLSMEIDELIGTRCDYHSNQDAGRLEAIAAGLCPPPEVFRGERTDGEVSVPGAKDGNLNRRRAEFLPLAQQSFDDDLVLVVVDSKTASLPDGEDVNLTDARQLHRQVQQFRQEIGRRYRLDLLVGQSTAIRRVRDQVRVAIQSQGRVLVVGPPGSGREHVAKTIHFARQAKHPTDLMVLDSSLLDAELMQSAITQLKQRPNASETGSARTLLLLDIDQMPGDAQHELVGFFNLPGFEIPALATARQPLLAIDDDAKFRTDLAGALSILVIEIPALCERPEDVPLLAQLFLEEENAAGGRQLSGFSPDALDRLAAYDWPGNVDELSEFVREACRNCNGPVVGVADLPRRIHLSAEAAADQPPEDETIVLDDFLAEIELELIHRALRRTKGNKTRAAQLLGINRARLHRRIAQLGISDGD